MVATMMSSLLIALFAFAASSFRTRGALQVEILALRHQLAVLQNNAPRHLRFNRTDRLLWVVLSRFWSGLAAQPADRSARHGHPLAQESFRLVLDKEIAAPPGKTRGGCQNS